MSDPDRNLTWRRGWLKAEDAYLRDHPDQEDEAIAAEQKRRADLARDRRERLAFLIEHDIEHPIDPFEVRY